MKKIMILFIGLTLVNNVFGQIPIAQYVLPVDLAENKAVDLIPALAEISSTASYIELTSSLSSLQTDLGTQTDNLNTNKNFLQQYTPLVETFGNLTYYSDPAKLATLITNYNNAMKIVKSNIETSKNNIIRIKNDREKITRTINDRMNLDQSQQSFRKWTSFIFAGLLAFIIGGFFFILFRNNSDKTASILMGESGLQFITLFSLIISIILFGVLNILEGKELAAIISAIAGFILGKYNVNNGNASSTGSSGVIPAKQEVTPGKQ